MRERRRGIRDALPPADIRAWLPKVKPGGVLGGDDWPYKGVQGAVRDGLGGQGCRGMSGAGVALVVDEHMIVCPCLTIVRSRLTISGRISG